MIFVYKSTSHNVWVNLSFEDWILSKVDLTCRRILFLWRNSPCVVIGRHQNPWLETNIAVLRDKGVLLARRRITRNPCVCEAVNRGWGLDLSVNKTMTSSQETNCSSSKLAKDSAFHHFTLLLCADTANMTTLLRPAPLLSLTNTSATLSRCSSTLNLSSRSHDITWDAACSHIASAFYSAHDITLTNQQMLVEVEPGEEGVFPGITKMAERAQVNQQDDLKRSNMAVKLRHGHHESEETCLRSDTFPYDHHGAPPPPADYSLLVPCTAITFEPIVAMEIVTLQMQTVLQVSQDLRPSNRAANEDLKPGVQVIRWTLLGSVLT
eukprot:Em0001g2928a